MKRKRLIGVLILLLLTLCSCGKRSGHQEVVEGGNSINYININDLSNYEKRGEKYREPINEVIDSFDKDLEYVKNKKDTKIIISDDTHIDKLQGFDHVDIYNFDYEEKTVGETKEILQEWLRKNNLPEAPDTDIHYYSDNNKGDISDLPEDAPMEKAGNFMYTHRDDYAVCACATGIYYASNGLVSNYIINHLSEEEKNSLEHLNRVDPWGDSDNSTSIKQTEQAVESGYYEDMKNKKYELIDGTYTVEEVAKRVEEDFNSKIYSPMLDGFELKVWWVEVYTLRDKYVYVMHLKEIINGVSTIPGLNESYGDCEPATLIMLPSISKWGVVADGNGVCAFSGTYMNGMIYKPIKSYKEMIGLREAVDLLDEKLADRFKIITKRVSFGYCEVQFDDTLDNENCHFPCWEFRGEAVLSEMGIQLNYLIFVDAISGDVIWHIYEPKDFQ